MAGHDWWAWASAQGDAGPARVRGQERAAYWYRLALPDVTEPERKTELRALVAKADADAEAFYGKAGVPRPIEGSQPSCTAKASISSRPIQ